MTEADRNTRFLSQLVVHERVRAEQALAQRLNEARDHERAVRRATAAVAILGLASVCGIGYSTLFAPELDETGRILLRLFYITGLASVICLFGFLCFWVHTRSHRRHLHEQCRTTILYSLEQAHVSLPNHPLATHDTTFGSGASPLA